MKLTNAKVIKYDENNDEIYCKYEDIVDAYTAQEGTVYIIEGTAILEENEIIDANFTDHENGVIYNDNYTFTCVFDDKWNECTSEEEIISVAEDMISMADAIVPKPISIHKICKEFYKKHEEEFSSRIYEYLSVRCSVFHNNNDMHFDLDYNGETDTFEAHNIRGEIFMDVISYDKIFMQFESMGVDDMREYHGATLLTVGETSYYNRGEKLYI